LPVLAALPVAYWVGGDTGLERMTEAAGAGFQRNPLSRASVMTSGEERLDQGCELARPLERDLVSTIEQREPSAGNLRHDPVPQDAGREELVFLPADHQRRRVKRAGGAPHAGNGVKQSLLHTVEDPDGGYQVAYGRHPLYTDAGSKAYGLVADRKAGDTHGQGFFGSWYGVSPTGTLIKR